MYSLGQSRLLAIFSKWTNYVSTSFSLMLGQYLYLEVKNAMLKLEIRNIIVIYLVDEEI
jgi:hypothetical protein